MNPVARRVITALGTAALAVALFLWCPLAAIFPLVLVLSTFVQLEFYQMAKAYRPMVWTGLALGAVWLAASAAFPVADLVVMNFLFCVLPFFLFAFLLTAVLVLFRPSFPQPVGTLAVTWAGFFYVPFLLSFFLRVVQCAGPTTMAESPWFAMPQTRIGLYTLLAFVAATKLSDMGGFAFGLAFGRHRMCPSVSPRKSWEGFAGSVLGSSVAAAGFCLLAQRLGWAADVAFWKFVTLPVAVASGVFIATLGTIGDLVESRFKRECGVKDSATFMPAGLGGFLDMFDSILFVPAFFAPFVVWAQYAA